MSLSLKVHPWPQAVSAHTATYSTTAGQLSCGYCKHVTQVLPIAFRINRGFNRVPSPHMALHGDPCWGIKLCLKKILKWNSFLNLENMNSPYFLPLHKARYWLTGKWGNWDSWARQGSKHELNEPLTAPCWKDSCISTNNISYFWYMERECFQDHCIFFFEILKKPISNF